jgi:hypothetical protein
MARRHAAAQPTLALFDDVPLQDVAVEEVAEVVVEPVPAPPVLEAEEDELMTRETPDLVTLDEPEASVPAPPEPVLSAIARRLAAVAVRVALAAE